MLYAVCNEKGYYVTFSKEAAEEVRIKLGSLCLEVVLCFNMKEVLRVLRMHAPDLHSNSIQIGVLVWWPPVQKMVLIDGERGVSYFCQSNGSVRLTTPDGKEFCYQICQNHLDDSKKTVRLLQKQGRLCFFDFDKKVAVTVTSAGECYERSLEKG